MCRDSLAGRRGNHVSREAEHLIDDWLDNSLSSAEEQQLAAWAASDPDHMQQFVTASIRDELLRDVLQSEAMVDAACRHVEQSRPRRSLPIRLAAPLAVAAAILVVAAIGYRLQSPDGVKVGVLAVSNVELAGAIMLPAAGGDVYLDSLQLTSGTLEVQLGSDVRVELVGPVRARFISDMRLQLWEGRISAEVGERGKGFTVVTDAGDVIDLGTRFGVEADADGECRVAVFRGKVQLKPRSQSARITLTEGQAARFSVLAGLRRWEQVALAAEAAGIAAQQYAGVVREVRDNLGDEELQPFYGVVSGGMRDGALAFTDKPNPRWHALPGEEFPAWLQGADQIRTYYQFHNRRRYELRLALSQPATVFVLQDAGQEPLDWLQRDFVNTGVQLEVGPWHRAIEHAPAVILKPDGPYLRVNVWKREVTQHECLLGPPRARKSDEITIMYGLAVKPLSAPQVHGSKR